MPSARRLLPNRIELLTLVLLGTIVFVVLLPRCQSRSGAGAKPADMPAKQTPANP